MTETRLQRYRQQLCELAVRVRGEVNDLRQEAFAAPVGVMAMSAEQADVASHEAEEGRVRGVLDAEEGLLHEVDDALARVKSGKFGKCAECQHNIPAPRLAAVPYTRYCIACAEHVEQSTVK